MALGLVVWTPGATADPPFDPHSVQPIIDHACPSGANLDTVWGYTNNTANPVTITQPDNGDDNPFPSSDGDNDDNFFSPGALTRPGQPNTFSPGTTHGVLETIEPAPLTWTTASNSATSSASLNCADVAVAKTQLLDTLTAGQQDQYTVTATNNGPTTAGGVVVTDTLPAGATGVTASSSQTSCSVASGTVTCAAVGTLAVNGSITVTISATLPNTGSLTDTAAASSTSNPPTYDPNPSNNSDSKTTIVGAPGGPSGGGILNTGQQLTFKDTAVTGTVKVTTGTVPLTASVGPCPAVSTVNCKSEAFNVQPHGTANGQILTAVFDTGRPAPFVLIPFVKFFYFKDDNIDHPLPFCPHYLKPIPPANGTPCEYFRWMDLHGHAIVYVAFGAQDPRTHR